MKGRKRQCSRSRSPYRVLRRDVDRRSLVKEEEEEEEEDEEKDTELKFDWIASSAANYTLCMVDADKIPLVILQQSKGVASSLLSIEGGVDKTVDNFPHHLDGGWPDVHPQEECVTYAQIRKSHNAEFKGVSALAKGSSKKKREQGVALALVVAACVEKPGVLGIRQLREHFEELPGWVAESNILFYDLRIRMQVAAGLPPVPECSRSVSGRKPMNLVPKPKSSDGPRSRGSMEEDLFQKENALKEERMINAELRSKLQQAEAKLLQVSMDVQQPTRDLETVAKKVAGISAELLHAMAKFRSLEF